MSTAEAAQLLLANPSRQLSVSRVSASPPLVFEGLDNTTFLVLLGLGVVGGGDHGVTMLL